MVPASCLVFRLGVSLAAGREPLAGLAVMMVLELEVVLVVVLVVILFNLAVVLAVCWLGEALAVVVVVVVELSTGQDPLASVIAKWREGYQKRSSPALLFTPMKYSLSIPQGRS